MVSGVSDNRHGWIQCLRIIDGARQKLHLPGECDGKRQLCEDHQLRTHCATVNSDAATQTTVTKRMDRMKTIGAVDIGGTKITVGAVWEDGGILERLECPTEPERGFHSAMERIVAMLRAISANGLQFEGIGVGCPGPLNPFTGLIGDVGTLPGWQRGSLIDDLQAGLNLPVVIENDADAAVLGEARWGSDATSGSFVYKECGRAEAGVLAFRG